MRKQSFSIAITIFAILSSLPIYTALSTRAIELSLRQNAYIDGDESYTVASDTTFFNDGYWGFRCLASNMNRCYGHGFAATFRIGQDVGLRPGSFLRGHFALNPISHQAKSQP